MVLQKGFGGVGMFVKETIYANFVVSIEYKDYEDMLGLLFTDLVPLLPCTYRQKHLQSITMRLNSLIGSCWKCTTNILV